MINKIQTKIYLTKLAEEQLNRDKERIKQVIIAMSNHLTPVSDTY